MRSRDVCLEVKGQSDVEIAGSPRNMFKHVFNYTVFYPERKVTDLRGLAV